jgi:4-hydroxy-2-oxoheptanedioate aldolase
MHAGDGVDAVTSLRERWAAGETTLGAWLAIPSVIVAEATARTGFDYVCADLQHGALDYADSVGLFQAALAAGTTPIARVPWNEPGIIGKVLDAGAEAVVVPMVNSPEEAAAAVRAARYPPVGARSHGPTVVGPRTTRYAATANDVIAVIPMIETVEAISRLDDILAVPGVNAVYVGPADLSMSLGLEPGNNDDDAGFREALAAIVAGCRRHGVVAGIHSTGTLAPRRIEQGFAMVTVTSDIVALRLGLSAELARARTADDGTSPNALY